jgi:hypothetical protein
MIVVVGNLVACGLIPGEGECLIKRRISAVSTGRKAAVRAVSRWFSLYIYIEGATFE